METNWTRIGSTNQPYRAELIVGILREYNIEAVTVNKQDSAYLFGEIEIYVSAENALQATQILATREEW